tara:strand:+ start:5803 stop:6240 length:438 start_codon:yes stop_codon:yes gene_type:complete
MSSAQTIILIAHENKSAELVKLIKKRLSVFEHYRLLATEETADAIKRETELEVTGMFSGRKGGEIQLCGLICSNCIRAVFFIRDPVSPAADEPDITPFYRACDLNNVPLATNMVGAVALTHWLGRKVEALAPDNRAPLSTVAEAG